jgi:HlyD family secretion protein
MVDIPKNKTGITNEFDTSFQLTSSGLKYFLWGISFLIIVLLAWGIFGEIPIKVRAFGIVTNVNQESIITSNYDGIVLSIYKKRGDTVHKGDRVIKLMQLDLTLTIDEKIFQLHTQTNDNLLQIEALNSEKKQKLISFENDGQALEKQISDAKMQIQYYEKLYDEKKFLMEKGIVSEVDLKQTEFNLSQQQLLLKNTSSQVTSLGYEKEAYINNVKIQIEQLRATIAGTREEIKNLDIRFEKSTYILATTKGIIRESLMRFGTSIAVGDMVFTIEDLTEGETHLYVDLFIPFTAKAKVAIGMKADIIPFDVNSGRYGQAISNVIETTNYPASSQFLEKILANSVLVESMLSHGPVYYARAKLVNDSSTVSGLKWSSKDGPPFKIEAGVLCSSQIYTSFKPPLSFVVPWIKNKMDNNE